MENSYYVRVRGRPQGPYTAEQLQAFARRGQFSRLHEVSADGVSWVRAGSFPELFTNEVAIVDVAARAAETVAAPVGDTAPPVNYALAPAPAAAAYPPAAAPEKCYYSTGGAQHGPVSFESLRALVASGTIGPHDLVWIEGQGDWTTAQRIPGLLTQVASEGASTLSAESLRTIAATRPWMLFAAVMVFVMAAAHVLMAVLWLVSGGRGGDPTPIVLGLCAILFSLLWVFHGFLLTAWHNRLGNAVQQGLPESLEQALHCQHRYWIFVGVQMIVYLVLFIILMVVIFAVGVSLAGRLS